MKAKELISYIASSLVDSPDDVEVNEEERSGDIVFYLKVKKEDLGKVIGKKGRTAKAIRTFISAVGARDNKRFYLDIVEPEQNSEDQPKENESKENSKKEPKSE